jgi:hypothetical protein
MHIISRIIYVSSIIMTLIRPVHRVPVCYVKQALGSLLFFFLLSLDVSVLIFIAWTTLHSRLVRVAGWAIPLSCPTERHTASHGDVRGAPRAGRKARSSLARSNSLASSSARLVSKFITSRS